jgi:FkbM family methyltransferase
LASGKYRNVTVTKHHLTEPYWEAVLRWHTYRRWYIKHRKFYSTAWAFQRMLRRGAGQLFIDCGANVGEIAAIALRHGMIVHAFEPDPIAATELRRRLGSNAMITIHQVAVGAHARHETLRASGAATLKSTIGSSLFANSHNDGAREIEVEVVDLFEFIRSLDQPIAAVKLDVEGAEFEILDRMLGEELVVPFVFVETHERISPEFGDRLAAIQARLKQERRRNIYLGWP